MAEMDESGTPEAGPVSRAAEFRLGTALNSLVDKAISVQAPTVDAYVAKLRSWSLKEAGKPGYSDGSPTAAVRIAEKQYLAAVTAMGASAGGAAAAPGVGVAAGAAVALIELDTNLEATTMFVLAVARIHAVTIDDLEHRRLLLYSVLLGQSAAGSIEKIAGRMGPHWGKAAVKKVPMATIKKINSVLGPRFITKYGTKQGVLVLGKVVPFGIGSAVGAAGNLAFGQMMIQSARKVFGPTPEIWAE